MYETLFLTIIDDTSGEILLQRKLADNDHLDCDQYARDYADTYLNADISSDGIVPLGCGQFTVEIARKPQSAVCWQARSYFTKAE